MSEVQAVRNPDLLRFLLKANIYISNPLAFFLILSGRANPAIHLGLAALVFAQLAFHHRWTKLRLGEPYNPPISFGKPKTDQ